MMLGDGPSDAPPPKAGDRWREWSAWKRAGIDGAVSFWIPFAPFAINRGASSVEIVAAQLRASVPNGDWNSGGMDRALEFARMLHDRRGVRDVSKLSLIRISISRDVIDYELRKSGERRQNDGRGDVIVTDILERREIRRGVEVRTGFALSYAGGEPWGFLHAQDAGPDKWAREFELEQSEGLTVAVDYRGKGGVRFQIAPGEFGFAIAPNWFSTSDAARIRRTLQMLAGVGVSIILPAVGINLAATIGNAMLGSIATQYPALASAMGRVVLSSAISGADLKQGIKGAALAFAGAEAGGLVASTIADATKLELVSRIAGSAVNAALQGGDPRRAAAMALLQNGIASMEIVYTPNPAPSVNASLVNDPLAVQTLPPSLPGFTLPPVSWADQAAPSVMPAPPIAPAITAPPVQASPGIDWRNLQNIVNFATNTAVTVARTVRAVRDAGNPNVVSAAQVTTTSGERETMLDDGFIRRIGADGRETRVYPPVGVPHSTVTGNLVINQGDGTFVLIRPNGSRTTNRYGRYTVGDAPGGSILTGQNSMLLIGGAVLLVAALAMRGKR